MYNTLSLQLKALVKTHFQSFGQGHLEQRIRAILQQHLKECYEGAQRSIDWVISLENRPFSTNEHYFFDYREKFLAHYRGTRQKQRNGSLVKSITSYIHQENVDNQPQDEEPPLRGIAKVLSGLAELGFQGIVAENLIKLLPADEMEPALTIMADSRAYFQGGSQLSFIVSLLTQIPVAYKRFADVIPMTIDHELVFGAQRGALDALYTALGIKGPEGYNICQELAQESPQIADRRADLQKRLERLETASQQLLHVGM